MGGGKISPISFINQEVTRPGRKCGSLGKTNCGPSMDRTGSLRSPAKHCGMEVEATIPSESQAVFPAFAALPPGPPCIWATPFVVGLGRGSGGKPEKISSSYFAHGQMSIFAMSYEPSATSYFGRPPESLPTPWVFVTLFVFQLDTRGREQNLHISTLKGDLYCKVTPPG